MSALALLWLLVAPALAAAETTGVALPPGLDMLRRTERAFAKVTAELGFRSGFLMFFADGSVWPPDTGNARTTLLAMPTSVEFRPTDLAWEPRFGDIARSGDLGYLTGPSSFTDRQGKKHKGVYFSVWRREASGLWFVVLDVGVDMPSHPPEFAGNRFEVAASSAWKPDSAGAAQHLESLKRAEQALIAAAGQDVVAAYRDRLDTWARLHREGAHPTLGREAILATLAKSGGTVNARLLRSGVSQAGDLGWTFGTCDFTAAAVTLKGTSSRVWKRDDAGEWRIVVDIFSPERK